MTDEYEGIEADDGVNGIHESYETKRGNYSPIDRVKCWNQNPQEPNEPRTPGMIIRTAVKEGDKFTWSNTIVPSIRASLLFIAPGRVLKTQQGKLICASDDGLHPATRIDAPLCRQATTQDLVNIMSTWKSKDEPAIKQAKIKANIQEVTEGTGKLMLCGLATKDSGVIPLCPYSRKNPITGAKASCKQTIFVHALDLDTNREFRMDLTGQSTYNNSEFRSPIHSFLASLVGKLPNGGNIPPYCYQVTLSPAPSGAFFYLNVSDYLLLNGEQRQKHKLLAHNAQEAFNRFSARLSKEAYEKSKQTTAAAKDSTAVVAGKPVIDHGEEVSFDVDDINF